MIGPEIHQITTDPDRVILYITISLILLLTPWVVYYIFQRKKTRQ